MESSNLEAQYKGESVKDWVHHLQDVIGNQTRSILESTFREVQGDIDQFSAITKFIDRHPDNFFWMARKIQLCLRISLCDIDTLDMIEEWIKTPTLIRYNKDHVALLLRTIELQRIHIRTRNRVSTSLDNDRTELSVQKPEPTPVVPEPTPVVPEPTPVVPEPTPVVPEPTPVVPEPTPVVPEPTPVVPEPTPVVPEPTPVVPEPTPVVPEPTPVVPEPTPVTGEKQKPLILSDKIQDFIYFSDSIGVMREEAVLFYDAFIVEFRRASPGFLLKEVEVYDFVQEFMNHHLNGDYFRVERTYVGKLIHFLFEREFQRYPQKHKTTREGEIYLFFLLNHLSIPMCQKLRGYLAEKKLHYNHAQERIDPKQRTNRKAWLYYEFFISSCDMIIAQKKSHIKKSDTHIGISNRIIPENENANRKERILGTKDEIEILLRTEGIFEDFFHKHTVGRAFPKGWSDIAHRVNAGNILIQGEKIPFLLPVTIEGLASILEVEPSKKDIVSKLFQVQQPKKKQKYRTYPRLKGGIKTEKKEVQQESQINKSVSSSHRDVYWKTLIEREFDFGESYPNTLRRHLENIGNIQRGFWVELIEYIKRINSILVQEGQKQLPITQTGIALHISGTTSITRDGFLALVGIQSSPLAASNKNKSYPEKNKNHTEKVGDNTDAELNTLLLGLLQKEAVVGALSDETLKAFHLLYLERMGNKPIEIGVSEGGEKLKEETLINAHSKQKSDVSQKVIGPSNYFMSLLDRDFGLTKSLRQHIASIAHMRRGFWVELFEYIETINPILINEGSFPLATTQGGFAQQVFRKLSITKEFFIGELGIDPLPLGDFQEGEKEGVINNIVANSSGEKVLDISNDMMDIPDKAGIEVHIATKDELQSFFLDFLIAQREFSPEKLEEEVKRLNKNQEQYIQYPLDFHDWIAGLEKAPQVFGYLHDFLSRFKNHPASNTQTAIAREFCNVLYPAFVEMNWNDFLLFLVQHETEYDILKTYTPFTVLSLFRLSGAGISELGRILQTIEKTIHAPKNSPKTRNGRVITPRKQRTEPPSSTVKKTMITTQSITKRASEGIRSSLDSLPVETRRFIQRVIGRIGREEMVPKYLHDSLTRVRIWKQGEKMILIFPQAVTNELMNFETYIQSDILSDFSGTNAPEYTIEIAGITIPQSDITFALQSEDDISPYSIMGIRSDSEYDDARKIYRKLMMQYHPDRDIDENLGYTKIASAITEAWRNICNDKGWNKD